MLVIESDKLAVEVLPEVGGKVGQIHEKVSGKPFLVPPQRPYRTISADGNWLKHDISGMDDCFPNVAAGKHPDEPWSDVELLDLGEWTRGVWEISTFSSTEIVMKRMGIALSYAATKTIRFVDDDTLEFGYLVENHSDTSFRYLWSAHPLITVAEDFELRLPQGELNIRVFPPDDYLHSWPICRGVRLSDDWIPHHTTLKTFITGLSEGWCALLLPTHMLKFTFELEAVPVVGIWFNNFGFPSDGGEAFRCIAIEPCTSPSDLLDELPAAAYPSIEAGGQAQWKMRLQISRR